MAAASDSGRTRALVAGLSGAAVFTAGVGGAVAMRRRRQRFVGPMMTWRTDLASSAVDDRARAAADQTSALLAKFRASPTEPAPPTPPNPPEPYVTLGHPPPVEPAGDPAEPGRDEGDGT
jgi:hypothetical protein